ncbi:hypothetical protein HOB10_04595 [Candidatus Parcubacteria bacterium]|jgi:alginate O-acetyltransferase complex protein AlgJ|nr:hypothetical protein [Candidatus Parcubacteria bacterium]
MKNIWLKLLIFISPLIVLVVVDLYVLPPGYFTYRSWEEVSYNRFDNFKVGPFYPNVKVNRLEEGNLGHHSGYAEIKEVEWVTDQYGYRSYEGKGHDTVVIGDSFIAGATLDQVDTFTEVLESMIDGDVYSMANANINDYLSDKRFSEEPPKRVIMASIRLLSNIETKTTNESSVEKFFKEKDITQEIIKEIDRFLKLRIIRYTNSALKRTINQFFDKDTVADIAFISNDVLFLKLKNDYLRRTDDDVKPAVSIIKSYHDYFTSQGIEFMFLPIPNKRDIYHELLPQEQKSNFVPLLVDSLQDEGVGVVNIYTVFEEAYENGEDFYHLDDTHWNKEGARVAAGLTADMINNTEE